MDVFAESTTSMLPGVRTTAALPLASIDTEPPARYQDLFATMSEGVIFQDRERGIIDANPAALHLLGLTFAQLQGRTSYDPRWRAIHLDGTDAPNETYPSSVALQTGQPIRDAILGIFLPGEDRYRWLRINAIPRFAPESSTSDSDYPTSTPISGVLVTFDDITGWDRLKETARITELHYRELLEQAVDAIFVADRTGRYIDVNPAACTLLGYQREELLGKFVVDMIPHEDVARVTTVCEMLQRGETHRAEWQLRRADGTLVTVEVSAHLAVDDRWLMIVRDITERKHLEQTLRRAEQETAAAETRFRGLVELAPDAFITTDRQGHITLVNRQTEVLFGFSRDELLGQPVEMLVPDRFRGAHISKRTEYVSDPHVRPMGARLNLFGRRKDGTELPVDVSLGTIRVRDEIQVIISARDITERKRLEQTLRTQAELLERMFEAIVDSIYLYDRTGNLVRTNAAARAFAGYDARPELLDLPASTRLAQFQPRNAQGRPLLPDVWPVLRVLRGEILTSAMPAEIYTTSLTGEERVASITGAPLHTATGDVDGAVMVSRDVSKQRHLEQALAEHVRALEVANRRLERFVGIVNHELKGPLSAALMALQLADRRITRARQRQATAANATSGAFEPPTAAETGAGQESSIAIEQEMKWFEEAHVEAEQQIKRMVRLVNDLLDITRIREDKISLTLVSCDLVHLVRDAIAEQSQVYPGRAIHLRAPETRVSVMADPDRIRQVVNNYLTNALKYSDPAQPVEVTVHQVGEVVRVAVHDHGQGIPPEHVARIWKAFEQLGSEKVSPGTSDVNLGLGLHICKMLVERHGGTVGVRSKVGLGSSFWFMLPLADPRVAV